MYAKTNFINDEKNSAVSQLKSLHEVSLHPRVENTSAVQVSINQQLLEIEQQLERLNELLNALKVKLDPVLARGHLLIDTGMDGQSDESMPPLMIDLKRKSAEVEYMIMQTERLIEDLRL